MPTSQQLWKRRSFATVLLLQIAIQGAIGAIPLWIIKFKRIFDITQAQTNVLGIAMYASVQLVGTPIAGVVVGWLKPHQVAGFFILLTFSGYGMMYSVAAGFIGHGSNAFIVLVGGIILNMFTLGILFSLYFSVMCRADMYGWNQIVFVSGISNSMLAVGAVASSCLFLFTELGLKGNLFTIWLFQGATYPLVVVVVYWTTRNPDKSPSSINGEDKALISPVYEDDAPVEAAADDMHEAEPEGCCDYIWASLKSWRYYHATLILTLKVGIGSTYTTNLGSAVAASMPHADEHSVDVNANIVVLVMNVTQLFGRLAFTSFSACGGNANVTTLLSICLVALGYCGIFAARILLDFTFHNLLIISGFFGFFYGTMWATSGGMYRLAPYSERPERAFAMIQPPSGLSTFALNSMAGFLYDQHASEGHMCYGKQCYYYSDVALASFSLALFLVSGLRLVMGVPDENGRWPHKY